MNPDLAIQKAHEEIDELRLKLEAKEQEVKDLQITVVRAVGRLKGTLREGRKADFNEKWREKVRKRVHDIETAARYPQRSMV